MFKYLVVWILLVSRCNGMNFTHYLFLDPDEKYEMWWKFNDEEITVKLQVQAKGWIGWGLSPNGNMVGSDIMLAWFESDGTSRIEDAYAKGKYRPVADKQQDFHLIEMKKEDNNITVVFKRKLLLCNEEDQPITTDTMRVVYAYGDSSQPTYHKKNKGVHSVLLLDYAKMKTNPQLPDNTKNFELRMNDDKALEPKDTLYVCKLFKGPNINGKHHIIRVEPIVQKGHESLVHHILLYACSGFVNESLVSSQHKCDANMPKSFKNCGKTLLHAWAIGGTTFNYPNDVGLSYGDVDDTKYFVMQVHYDNPHKLSTFKDKSGLRMYYTKNLRKYDAGVLSTGVKAKPYATVIPQKKKSFKLTGYCTSDCLGVSESVNRSKIFAGMLHTHIQGRKIVTRLVRDSDGVEVKRILQDLNYDFNFQELRHLPNEIEIPPGHSIHVECTYNTEDRDIPVVGGRATRDEMCFAFLMIYPPLEKKWCVSINMPTFGTFQEENLKWKIRYDSKNMGYINQDLVIGGTNYSGQPAWTALKEAELWNSNPELAQKWEQAQIFPKFVQQCSTATNKTINFNDLHELKLNKVLPYDDCVGQNDNTSCGIQQLPHTPFILVLAFIISMVIARYEN